MKLSLERMGIYTYPGMIELTMPRGKIPTHEPAAMVASAATYPLAQNPKRGVNPAFLHMAVTVLL